MSLSSSSLLCENNFFKPLPIPYKAAPPRAKTANIAIRSAAESSVDLLLSKLPAALSFLGCSSFSSDS